MTTEVYFSPTTRFTEDIFAFLISLIFIGEPVTSLVNVFKAHPLGIDYHAAANPVVRDNLTQILNSTVTGKLEIRLVP